MKILLINTSERTGGAAVACNRLYKALNKYAGVEARLLVKNRQTDDLNVISVKSLFTKQIDFIRFLWERLIIWLNNGFSKKGLFLISLANTGRDITNIPEVCEADIIHLHWVNQGMLSLRDIDRLLELGKPIVWTMHDMWPFTGICHYAGVCTKFRTECKNCPLLNCPSAKDLSFRTFLKKEKLDYNKITFVACSHWLEDIAGKSELLQNTHLVSIPNPINITLFSPMEKKLAKERFHLSPAKSAILFGAVKISDPRKGFEYFCKAMELLACKYPEIEDKLELVFLGDAEVKLPQSIPYSIHYIGYLRSEEEIASLYSAVDVFVIPSLEDNLPNTVMEALACGTPVAGFDTGGIPEMVDHMKNGYIANYKDCEDLMTGIYWTLFESNYHELMRHARNKVVNNYAEKKIAENYFNLYRQLCRKN